MDNDYLLKADLIDLDNYTERELSQGIHELIRNDIIKIKFWRICQRKRLKYFFREWSRK